MYGDLAPLSNWRATRRAKAAGVFLLRYPGKVKAWLLSLGIAASSAWAGPAAAPPPAADAAQWRMLDRVPYAALEDWASWAGFRAYPDLKTGRILLEKKAFPPLILLMGAPYALQGEKFLALPQAPRSLEGKVFLSAGSGEQLFLALLKGSEKKTVEQNLSLASAQGPSIPKPALSGSCGHGRTVKRIFLDPGHGGDDAGTKHEHVNEKDVVLSFGRLAADELTRRGFEVSFSRSRDVFLPLDIRTKLAEEWKADLFISLHVNSSPAISVHGTETYILSPDATDAEARKLALLENSVAKEARAGSSAVQDILWDMEQNIYLQDSAYLASYIQGSIVANAHDLLLQHKAGDWKNRGVRQAPFYVLNRAPMPAVLVELGYLSNPRDRKLLTEKYFQESLAKALAEGVKKYKEACRTRP